MIGEIPIPGPDIQKNSQAIQDTFDASQRKKADDDAEEAYFGNRSGLPIQFYDSVYKDPTKRDPRGYILSADQPDFSTAIKFLNALIKSGISVHKATADFSVAGKKLSKGILCRQDCPGFQTTRFGYV
ncbi:hypothetical protein [Algoriphagus boritolerans]|uniref:hypothetical protein n=1 Tax=Algoriphagus boritolerans TaxID=308111 RepID=UPI000B2331A6